MLKTVLANQARLLALEKKVDALQPVLPVLASLEAHLQQSKKANADQNSVSLYFAGCANTAVLPSSREREFFAGLP